MTKLHNSLLSKHIYTNENLPFYFKIENLFQCAEKFVDTLRKNPPEEHIIRLYTDSTPFYYRTINHILNLLDEELISLIGDYIKALRYSLIKYSDTSNKIPSQGYVHLYRGLHFEDENGFQQFLTKFKTNDVIVFPAFSSTSLNINVAENFALGKAIILIISADCSRSKKPKSISALSNHNEDEVLLNCFSLLKINKITKLNDDLTNYECTLE